MAAKRSDSFELVLLAGATVLLFLINNIWGNLFYGAIKLWAEKHLGVQESTLIAGLSQSLVPTIASIGIVWGIYQYAKRQLALPVTGTHEKPVDNFVSVTFGETGQFEKIPRHSLYSITRQLDVCIRNNSVDKSISGGQLQILKIVPESGARLPRLLQDNITLAAGAEIYVPLVSFGEARETEKFNCADTLIEVLGTDAPHPIAIDHPSILSMRVTALNASYFDANCEVFVDQNGKLRIRDCAIPKPTQSRDELVRGARLALARLRDSGVVLRNHAQNIIESSAWESSSLEWLERVIADIKTADEADAIWFRTLDTVPPARVRHHPNATPAFAKAFREHDFRLKRLDDLLLRYAKSSA